VDDTTLLRYSRQILLPEVDVVGQQRLADSHVLIIGLGGLGSPLALYLAAAGVGTMTLCDFDVVELSNLQRQILHNHARLGQSKVDSACAALRDLNPHVQLRALPAKLAGADLAHAIRACDVVADGSDNFATRFAVNAACVAQRVPLVSAAAIRWEGQLSVFDPRRADSPCYRCLYPDHGELAETCANSGVLGPVVGTLGCLQAVEVLKVLLGLESLVGRLLLWDALRMDFRTLRLRKDPACPVCG